MEQSSQRRTGRVPSTYQGAMSQDIFGEEYDDVWPSRTPSSTRRYRSDVKTETGRIPADVQSMTLGDTQTSYAGRKHAVPSRRGATQPVPAVQGSGRRRAETEEIAYRRGSEKVTEDLPKRRPHWLVYAVLAVCIMILGWFLFSIISNWWRVLQDDWRYGRPRTYQTDQIVGHNDSQQRPSHFIALNLNRQIQVIEFPGGDATKAKVYLGPTLVGQGQDLSPATLTFKDVTKDGKVDMIVNVQDSHFVFVNDKDQFRPPKSDEHVQP